MLRTFVVAVGPAESDGYLIRDVPREARSALSTARRRFD